MIIITIKHATLYYHVVVQHIDGAVYALRSIVVQHNGCMSYAAYTTDILTDLKRFTPGIGLQRLHVVRILCNRHGNSLKTLDVCFVGLLLLSKFLLLS